MTVDVDDAGRTKTPWPAGGGIMGALVRAHDWSRTSLGPIETWPQCLRTAVDIVLSVRHPAFIFWGSDHVCLYNEAFSASLGPEKHPSILGARGPEAWPDIWSVIGPQIGQIMSGGEPTWHKDRLLPVVRHGRLEDVYWTYSHSPISDAGAPNGVGGVLVLCVETTQAVASQHASESRFRALLEASSQVVYSMNPDWSEMRHLNGGGFIPDTAKPNRDWMQEYIHPDDQPLVTTAIRQAVQTKSVFDLEHRVRSVDGSLGWTHSRAVPVLSADGEISEWFGVASDITDRKRAEEALSWAKEQSDRANVAKSKFLAAAAHDLRQPMQSLLLFLEVLKPHVGPKGLDAFKHLGRGLDALRDLLDSLLDISRLDAGIVEPVIVDFAIEDLVGQIGTAYTPIAAAKGIALKVSACTAIVRSDRTLLGRMVRNLVENALRYTTTGQITVECHQGEGHLRIEVHDTGIGIPSEHLELIWEEFHQVGNPERDRNRGLGLGLAIVQRLSVLLGHAVQVRSTPGQGSMFAVEVPLGEVAPALVPASTTGSTGHGRFVVLVDDDAMVLLGLKATFEGWGYAVLATSSADQALTELGKHGQRPDVVVADYRLRERRSGTEAILRIRDAYGVGIAGIILTGETGGEVRHDAAVHNLHIIHKPVTPRQLRDALEQAMVGDGDPARE